MQNLVTIPHTVCALVGGYRISERRWREGEGVVDSLETSHSAYVL